MCKSHFVIMINSEWCPLLFTCLLWDQPAIYFEVRKWGGYGGVSKNSALYPQFLLQWYLSMCSFTSHFCFVHLLVFSFFLLCFSWQPSFRNVEANFHRLFLPSFSHFSIANFKHCWVISPFFSRFPPFQNSHHTPFPLPSPKPLPMVPPLILPSSRPLSTSTKFIVHFRPACTVNPFLFRFCLEVLF